MTDYAEGSETGATTRETLVAECETAFRAWKAATEGTAAWSSAYVAYIAAAHALHRFDMPHLAALADPWVNAPGPAERRPDAAEETEYYPPF